MITYQSKLWTSEKANQKVLSMDPFGQDLPIGPFTFSVDRLFQEAILSFATAMNKETVTSADALNRIVGRLVLQTFNEQWLSDMKNEARRYIAPAYADGADTGDNKLRSIGASVEDVEKARDAVRDALAEAVDRQTTRLSNGLGDTFKVKLREIVGEGIEQGETPRELSNRVIEWAGSRRDPERATRSRAMMIARTETRRAQIDAQVVSWRASGLVQGKQWLLAPNPCQFCQSAARLGVIPIDKPFYRLGQTVNGVDGGLMRVDYETIYGPALHPNCRCDLLPVPMKQR
jgi:hypothetical protein